MSFWCSLFQLTNYNLAITLDGIYKPISNNCLSLLQMASLSPFPQLHFVECKFLGTLVFNHLPPSSHEWRARQSNSSGLRKLIRGNCCTPKFALSFLKNFFHKIFYGSSLQHWYINLGLELAQGQNGQNAHWKVKHWLLDQNQVSRITFHQDMVEYEIGSSRKSKVKITLEKSKL